MSPESVGFGIYVKLLDDAASQGTLATRAWLERYPRGIAWLYATFELEGQVYNGGFHQYFWNTGGALLDIAVTGYEHFDCPRHVQLARRAARIAGRELDASRSDEFSDVRGFLQAFHDSEVASTLLPIDTEWYALDDAENADERRDAAIGREPMLYARDRRD